MSDHDRLYRAGWQCITEPTGLTWWKDPKGYGCFTEQAALSTLNLDCRRRLVALGWIRIPVPGGELWRYRNELAISEAEAFAWLETQPLAHGK